MVTDDTKLAAMEKVPLFARCSRSELARIAGLADEIDVPAGKMLTREGAAAREFFVILAGTADVRQDTRLLPPLRDGDFFGEIGLVTDSARTATVTAATAMRLLVITVRDFRELLRKNPAIQSRILQAVADRLAVTA